MEILPKLKVEQMNELEKFNNEMENIKKQKKGRSLETDFRNKPDGYLK